MSTHNMTENMAGTSPHVTFRKVQKTYDGENLIVRDLNLDIQRGEFLTLLGPSGSGKTTSLMMLAGFETPTSGEIRLGDRVINSLPPHYRELVVLRDIEELTIDEIAQTLDASREAVKARLHRARALLREYLQR